MEFRLVARGVRIDWRRSHIAVYKLLMSCVGKAGQTTLPNPTHTDEQPQLQVASFSPQFVDEQRTALPDTSGQNVISVNQIVTLVCALRQCICTCQPALGET